MAAPMSTQPTQETLERLYRITYWDHNELQLIAAGHPSTEIDAELQRSEDTMKYCCEALGYTPCQ